jgi:hypothetical protein
VVGPAAPSPTETTPVAGPTTAVDQQVWLAVFETAVDPNDLEDIQGELLQSVGLAIVVSPATCFAEGLSADVPGDHYVAGVEAETEEELSELVDTVGRDPIFTGEVVDVCIE